MNPDEDYYRVLGVLDDAEDVVIRAAYRALAQRYHPDKWQGDPAEVSRRMAEINAAYEVLSDSLKRRQYDLTRSDLNSYKKQSKKADSGPGKETNSKPETDNQSGYAAAKGFKERAGRASPSSSFNSNEENNPLGETDYENQSAVVPNGMLARLDSVVGEFFSEPLFSEKPLWIKCFHYLFLLVIIFFWVRWLFNGGPLALFRWVSNFFGH